MIFFKFWCSLNCFILWSIKSNFLFLIC
jgi:hypothetical protein